MQIRNILAVSVAALSLAACATMPSMPTGEKATTTPKNSVATPASSTVSAPVSNGSPVATAPSNVATVINAFVVRSVDGAEVLEPVAAGTAIKSGDLIEYQGLFTNTGSNRIRQMNATLTVPAGVAFTGVTEPALGVKASVDNSRFVFMPIRANVNGNIENLPFSQYQALQWNIEELGIGATAVVKYRATVQ